MHPRMKLLGLCFCVFVALSDVAIPQASNGERSGRTYAESLRLRCGPRAAWAFSRCCGTSLDHDATMDSFVQRDDGVSLSEIVDFLVTHGIRCESRCLSPTDLTQENCPAIVHLAPSNEQGECGHFVVVVAADESGVTVLDPQISNREKWTWQFFSDRWTGHCIMRSRSGLSDHLTLLGCVLLNALIVSICLFYR